MATLEKKACKMTLLEQVARLDELEKGASAAPWHTGHVSEKYSALSDIDSPDGSNVTEDVVDWNRNLIIELRNAWPQISAALREAVEALESLEDLEITIGATGQVFGGEAKLLYEEKINPAREALRKIKGTI